MITAFRRYELKYLLHREQARALFNELASQLPADPYSGLQGYWVNSLYYDSPDLQFFWAKVDGQRFRRKLRLRSYHSDPETPSGAAVAEPEAGVSVEIKQRLDRVIEKRRILLSRPEAEALCSGHSVLASDTQGQQLVQEVLQMVHSLQLQPTCLVRYHRRALMGNAAQPDLRITFDTQLCCSARMTAAEAPQMQAFLPPEVCVLEVKVSESMPPWLQQILSRHGCQLQRMSKYCLGLAQERQLNILSLKPVLPTWPEEQAS